MTAEPLLPSPGKLIRDALKRVPDPKINQDKVALDIFHKILPENHEHYLLEFIKLAVPNAIHSNRTSSINSIKNAPAPVQGKPEPEPQAFFDDDETPPPLVRPKINTSNIDAMRERAYNERILVGTVMKFIRDLTAADCRQVAQQRDAQAGVLFSQGDMYRGFADTIDASGKKTLGDIPDEFVRALNPKLL